MTWGRFTPINTLGGVVGAFGTGFLLIEAIGLSNTLYLAACTNFIVAGIVSTGFSEPLTNPNNPVQEKTKSKKSGTTPEKAIYSRKLIYLTLAVFGVSGFTSLAYEVYWTKILTYFLQRQHV